MSSARSNGRLIAAQERWAMICAAPDEDYTALESMIANVELYRAERAAGLWL